MRIIHPGRRDILGEGLFWSERTQALFWTDILGRRVNRLRLSDETLDSWSMPDTVGWIIERQRGGFIVGLGGRIATFTLEDASIGIIANPEPDRDNNRMNDAIAAPTGEIWFGTMPRHGDRPTGGLYRLGTDRAVVRFDDGYVIANGPAFSPSGDWIYHTDSALGLIYRFPTRPDGSLGPREVFIEFDAGWGKPDGMAVDVDGGLWVACWGSSCVTRFTHEGKRDRVLEVPAANVTNCAFGGASLDRMFVTSAEEGVVELGGSLFEVDPKIRGLSPALYGG